MKFVSSNFFYMDKSSKKSDVGDVKALMLFAGENRITSNDLNAKTVVYYSRIISQNNVKKIVLFGLESGLLNAKHTKLLCVIVVIQKTLYNVLFTLF